MRKMILLAAARRNVPAEFLAEVRKLAEALNATPGYEVVRGEEDFLLRTPDLVLVVLDYGTADPEVTAALFELNRRGKKPPVLGVRSRHALILPELEERVLAHGDDIHPYEHLAHDVLEHVRAKFSALAEAA